MQSFKDFDFENLLGILILAPILEEILCRIHLSGKKRHAWGALLMVIAFTLLMEIWWALLFILLFVGFVILYYDEFAEFIAVRFFNQVFYFSIFLFAFAHIHQIEAESFYVKFFIVLIYLPISLYFGYARKKYGLAIAICAHSLYNFSVLAINSQLY